LKNPIAIAVSPTTWPKLPTTRAIRQNSYIADGRNDFRVEKNPGLNALYSLVFETSSVI